MRLLFPGCSPLRPWLVALLLAALASLCPRVGQAASCTSRGSGNWGDSGTWHCTRGRHDVPRSADHVTIRAGDAVTVDDSYAARSVTVNSGGVLLIGKANSRGDETLTVSGDMTVGGTFQVARRSRGTHALDVNGSLSILAGGRFSQQDDASYGSCEVHVGRDFSNAGTYALGADLIVGGRMANSGTLDGGTDAGANIRVGGDFASTPDGAFDANAATLIFDGSRAQTVSAAGATTIHKLTVSNAAGVTLDRSLTTDNLALVRGAVVTGGNILTVSSACPSAVTRDAGYVLGFLRLTFPAGTHTCTFDVGSGGAYAPVSVAVAASGGGTLSASTVGNEHPQIAASPIDASSDANRYWTIGTGGDTLAAKVGSYAATFNFAAGDLDDGAASGSFGVARYSGGIWNSLGSVTANASSTGVSGMSGPIALPADFAVGQAASACPVPAGLPDDMTCVCDNFGRDNLNPSPIYGGDWALSTSGGRFGLPRILRPGYLRMTDNSNGNATAATMPGIFPAAGNLIQIEFKHYAYDGSGADGLALTLSDATRLPLPGAFGGSLGYAQKARSGVAGSDCASADGCPGFAGGWVGIALDEYGGFSANTEGRSGGRAPGPTPDAIAVRGSGAGLTGYPYLAGSGSLSPGIDNPASANPANGDLYRIRVDARNYTASHKTTLVSVDRDTSGSGNNYTPVVAPFDAFVANPAQAPVPADWKLSFTGSTGSLTNIHEIGALKICAQTILRPAGYRIQIDNLAPLTCGSPNGSPASPVITVIALDSNGNTVATYGKTVTLYATLADGSASHAGWSRKSGNGTLSGNQYTFAAADQGVAQFYLTDASAEEVYITVKENGGTLSSTTPAATPVRFSGSAFAVTVPGTEPLDEAVVAGRAHQLRVTRTTCTRHGSVTDTSYRGNKPLDGWYVPDADHPAGALAPRICAPNAGNTCLPSPGACQPLSAATPNPNADSNNISLAFAYGSADFCLATADVGKYSIFLRDDTDNRSPVTGASPVLTARPFAVAVSNVKAGSVGNPLAGSPPPNESSPLFITAGASFQATVSGYLWNSAGDANGDGLPDATAGWTGISAGGLAPHYADTVALSAGAPFAPATADDTPAGNGKKGVLDGSPVVVSAGSATRLSLSYSEVGSFSLHAQPATKYLNTEGANLANRVAIFANPSLSTQSAWVGRFKPDHFAVDGTPVLIPRSDINGGSGCASPSAFTYMSEPMRIRFTLKAFSLGGTLTQNYAGPYAHLAPGGSDWLRLGAPNSMGLWMVADDYPAGGGTCSAIFSPGGATVFKSCTGATPEPIASTGPRVALTGASSSGWAGGEASFSADAMLERAHKPGGSGDMPDGPYASLSIGIAPRDAEGVAFSSYNLDADTASGNERSLLNFASPVPAARYGRLLIPDNYGSELLPMPVRLQTQYWNGNAYINNTDDSCTPIDGGSFVLSNPTGGIASTTMIGIQGTGSLDAGSGTITLSKPSPSPTGKGYVKLAPASALGAYLPGSGIESFGVYRGGRVIYRREGHY